MKRSYCLEKQRGEVSLSLFFLPAASMTLCSNYRLVLPSLPQLLLLLLLPSVVATANHLLLSQPGLVSAPSLTPAHFISSSHKNLLFAPPASSHISILPPSIFPPPSSLLHPLASSPNHLSCAVLLMYSSWSFLKRGSTFEPLTTCSSSSGSSIHCHCCHSCGCYVHLFRSVVMVTRRPPLHAQTSFSSNDAV